MILNFPNAVAQGEIGDYGDFVLQYESRFNLQHSLQDVVDDLNEEFNLNETVRIIFSTQARIESASGEKNVTAGFDRNNTNDIYISDEYVNEINGKLNGNLDALDAVITHIMLHEVGHALIHVNQIETTDDAEIVADKIAFFIMSEFYENVGEQEDIINFLYQAATADSNNNADGYPTLERVNLYRCWTEGLEIEEGLSGDEGSAHPCFEKYESLYWQLSGLLEYTWKEQFDTN